MNGLRQYWQNLSPREQRVLAVGGLAALAILFYALFWTPLQDRLQQLRPQVASQSADLAWMQQQADLVRKLKQTSPVQRSDNALPLLTVVDQTARALKIREFIKQIQPGRESGTAKVWFDKVVFEDWLRWLDQVSAKGITITRVSITKSAEYPKVNVRMELARQD